MLPEASPTVERPARAPRSSFPNREWQDSEKQRQTSCGAAFAKGTCILLAVFVFSFGALLCAFLMNVTDCWALQITAYAIATSATLVSLFFVAHVRTDSDQDPAETTSTVRRSCRKGAHCGKPRPANLKSGRGKTTHLPVLPVPFWPADGLDVSHCSQDWYSRSQQHLPSVLSFPRPAPVHLSPPANRADMEPIMTFEGAMARPPPKSPMELSPC
ncbi:uncharacterized protein LOC144167497 isoform X1 [Haemaphysalis longicornis]